MNPLKNMTPSDLDNATHKLAEKIKKHACKAASSHFMDVFFETVDTANKKSQLAIKSISDSFPKMVCKDKERKQLDLDL